MTTIVVVTALILAAILLLWWLADHRRGIEWVQRAVRRKFPDVPSISAADLRLWLEDKGRAQPMLLDVRGTEEFSVSHLSGARRVDANAPAQDAMDANRTHDTIVVYCAGGYRSAKMCRRLMEAGFRNVHNLDGGIFAWFNAGNPVVRGGQLVDRVHTVSRAFGRLLRRPEIPGDSAKHASPGDVWRS